MNKEQLLNGSWEFQEYMGEDWRNKRATVFHPEDVRPWKMGMVPGSVHHDLWQNGEVPNPYFQMNSKLLEWVPLRTWVYRKSFFVDETMKGKTIELLCKGIDYEATFFLNETELGRHAGMFTKAQFDVSGLIRFGEENLLAIVLAPAPPSEAQIGSTSKVRHHKTRMNYGWDFCPRMVHVGIWDDVVLSVRDSLQLENVFIRSQLNEDFSRARLLIEASLLSSLNQSAAVEIQVFLGGRTAATTAWEIGLLKGTTKIDCELDLARPELWWPNGYGEQPLYELEVKVKGTGQDTVLKRCSFGIRKIEFLPNETPDSSALPYTLSVNGRRIYIKGWNWVPMDVLYGVSRQAKMERLLQLAKRAHVNMLRVWGGGLIEKEAFYDWCDRHGILIWQEFNLSSSSFDNKPSDDPAYIAMMVKDAREIVMHKRNHPALALWVGGNELEGWNKLPLDDREPILLALRQVVRELDPERYWLPCSASGPMPYNGINTIRNLPLSLHDVHGPWVHQGLQQQYEMGNLGCNLLHSEFGAEGLANLQALETMMERKHQWPVTLKNPVWHHLGSWWVKEEQWKLMLGQLENLRMLVEGTQFLQAEAVRYLVEANRRRKYQNSGSLPWMLNEPYPMAAGTSAVDYYGEPKALYYAVSRAYQPLSISAKFPAQAWGGLDEFTAEIWISHSLTAACESMNLLWRIVGENGEVYGQDLVQTAMPSNAAWKVAGIRKAIEEIGGDMFFLDLKLADSNERPAAESRYLFSKTDHLAPLFHTSGTALQVEVTDRQENRTVLAVTNTGRHAAMQIRLNDEMVYRTDGYVYMSDNLFTLFPNEMKQVYLEFENRPEQDRLISLQGWNTEKYDVKV